MQTNQHFVGRSGVGLGRRRVFKVETEMISRLFWHFISNYINTYVFSTSYFTLNNCWLTNRGFTVAVNSFHSNVNICL